ncbi:MAG TPA: thioredoxin [Ardenticatenaceae bacterium]|nr:thioredoxin [Ardenticatenaceae bacterium]
MAETTAISPVVIDVGEATFAREVIERSRQVPVVVDFWAPWCGPCRMLGPILEGLAQEYGGRFILAKLNTDENQRLAGQFRIQGIPAVKAFKDGRVVAEFVGAQPRPKVRQFIERLLPNDLDRKVAEGRALIEGGAFAQAEGKFRETLAQNPDHPKALLGLAEALLGQGMEQGALQTLERVPAATEEGAEAARLTARIKLRQQGGVADVETLQARLAQGPDDLETRFALAGALAADGSYREALEHYLEIVRRDRSFRDDGARQAMLHIFELFGDDPLVREYRNKLASLLFA